MLARLRPYPPFKKPLVSAQELWLHKVPFRRKQKELSSNSLRKLKSKLQGQSERIAKKKTNNFTSVQILNIHPDSSENIRYSIFTVKLKQGIAFPPDIVCCMHGNVSVLLVQIGK